ncbi:hypothetical protein Wcon_01345 [Wolbachia endosymbiont of Cylisticus convexus]|nr:hypothetical protein Wcon_01345 [Wolbachia endosymbiont of Cylisticus convexus]
MVKLCSKPVPRQTTVRVLQFAGGQCLTLESSFLVISLKILHSALVYNQFSWIPVSEHWDDTICYSNYLFICRLQCLYTEMLQRWGISRTCTQL